MDDVTRHAARLRMVEIVLHWAWDPIGIRGIEEAIDEYDLYAGTVLDMLERKAADQEVADYLTSIERDRMGLQPRPEKNADVAEMLGHPSILRFSSESNC
ncbi:hypothetical protein [Sphingobium algorifonticola]|uniref:Uncharacterized protein n=1 Tax=Sphingobium algorifonticola TaxID=2008318 RepID=A0A437J6E4_9SPHN|nr:hypothetical protein [Sphingobium algorifonticola]RVT40748.1 hypothetical protein ENE74_09705 [Sphingobium algorifonticola]